MLTTLRAGLGRKPGLVPVPAGLLGLACRLTGREALFARVAEGLEARADGLAALGWRPAAPTRDGLARLAREGG
jgi:UDP-glucose 4-epimerase